MPWLALVALLLTVGLASGMAAEPGVPALKKAPSASEATPAAPLLAQYKPKPRRRGSLLRRKAKVELLRVILLSSTSTTTNPFDFAGNDTIDAGELFRSAPAGNLPTVGITAYGGEGNDTIIGSQTHDHLAGGSGNDVILGEVGNDALIGGTQDDQLWGGDGNDQLSGDLGNWRTTDPEDPDSVPLYFRGQDTLHGGDGDDRLYGEMGDDRLYGDAGSDLLFGGHGEDWLEGGSGDDELYGGAGDDVLVFDPNDSRRVDGGAGSDTLTGEVQDDPVVAAGADQAATEGSTVDLSTTFVDSASDTHSATIDWGDGSVATGTVDQDLDTVGGSHAYADNGVFTVTVTVTDAAALTDVDSFDVTVSNAAPSVTPSTNLSVVHGDTTEFAVASFTDPGSADTHTASIDWGDGTISTGTVDQGLDTVGGTHVYADNGVFTVTVTVTDAAALSDADSLDVTVSNATPTLDVAANTSVFFGGTIDFAVASFTDAGSADTHTASIDWGDGDVSAGTIDQGAGTIVGTHEYQLFSASTVTRTVTVTITDDDGAVASDTFTVDVVSAPPVPGTTTWGLVALGVLLAGAALVSRRRSRAQPAPAP